MTNWSMINQDILSLIITKIKTPSDHIRISGVCSSWRSVAKQHRCTLSHPIPGLILSLYNNNTLQKNSLSFFSFQDENSPLFDSHHFYQTLKISCDYYKVYGSHHGWVVLTAEDQISTLSITFLYNPFTERCRLLPNMPKKAVKALLSCSPSLEESKCVVLVLFEKKGASFCRLGDLCWTKLSSFYNDECFCDALFFKGRFYVVDDHGKIYTIDLDQELISEISSQPSDVSKRVEKFYLVDVNGRLCRVLRKFAYSIASIYYDDDENEDDDDGKMCGSDMTRMFRVWVMDTGTEKWVEQKSLGEYSLFLGKNSSICLSEYEGKGIRGNKVYFTDDRERIKHLGCIRPGEDMGVFDFGDSSIESLCSFKYEWWTDPAAVWVAPLPW